MTKKEAENQNKKVDKLEEELESLREQIKTAETEKQKVFEQLQRVGADYANFQKRSAKQISESITHEKMAILRSLLPSLDNFERALAGAISAQGEECLKKSLKESNWSLITCLKH